MKNVVFHDSFHFHGGGEAVAVEIAQYLNAEIVTGHFEPTVFKNAFFKETSLRSLKAYDKKVLASISQTAALWSSFAGMERMDVATAWFSGQVSPLGHRNIRGRKILYCHTPPRILYDLRAYYLEKIPLVLRPIYLAFLQRYEKSYIKAVKDMDVILANSETVQGRISKYLGERSRIIYPPCGAGFKWLGQDDYYLSTARLSPLKRVKLIVEAFLEMPDKNLVVVSGGECEQKLRKMSANAANISIKGYVSRKNLVELMGNCIASIYIPTDEDFGMSPVESMAAGKPVIGVAEGGLKETIVHGETGLLLPSPPKKEDLQSAIRELSFSRAAEWRTACESQASFFSPDKFYQRIDSVMRRSGSKRLDHGLRWT